MDIIDLPKSQHSPSGISHYKIIVNKNAVKLTSQTQITETCRVHKTPNNTKLSQERVILKKKEVDV